MDIWTKARTFAQEAAKRSQELTLEAAKRSQEFSISDLVSEASKRSMDFADQIKSLSIADSSPSSSSTVVPPPGPSPEELEDFGVTDELREFVKEIKISTFQEFPLPDDSSITDVPAVSNVSQDLSEWQAKHANLVLLTVKEISKLRYELCPRFMKDRQFWRIYFILVNNHVARYEKQYMEKLKLKEEEEEEEKEDKAKATPKSEAVSGSDGTGTSQQLKTSKSSSEQDLDAFLLGDLGDDDNVPDDGDDEGFDDDFDKIDDNLEDEGPKDSKQK